MKKNRLIFYSVFGVLHLFIFVFSIYMDGQSENLQFLFQMQGKIWLLKYCSFILLILFGVNIVLHIRDNRRNTKEKNELTKELTSLKARLYDLQEISKQATPQNPETN